MDKKQTIGWGQFLLLLFMCRVFTLMTFVPLISQGRDLSVQIGAAAISSAIQALLLIPAAVLGKGVTHAAVEKNKAAGTLAAILYFVFFIFYCVNSLLRFRDFLSSRFFPTAGSTLWIGALLLICVYCGCLGTEALGRSAVLLFWIFIIALAVMTASSANDFDITNLSFGKALPNELFPAVLDDLSRSGEICAAVFLAGHVSDHLKRGIYGLVAAKLLLTTAAAILITAVLGDFAQLTDYPFLAVGTFSGNGFIQRGDALYLIVWTVTAVINIALFLHICAGLIGNVFPKLKFRTLISAAVVFAVTLCFTLTDKPFSGIYDVICSGWSVMILAGAVPLMVLIAQRKGSEKSK